MKQTEIKPGTKIIILDGEIITISCVFNSCAKMKAAGFTKRVKCICPGWVIAENPVRSKKWSLYAACPRNKKTVNGQFVRAVRSIFGHKRK